MYVRTVAILYLKRLANLLPFGQGRNYVRFAILGRARTGSTLLHTYLNNHPHVLSLDEFLHPSRTRAFTEAELQEYVAQTGFKKYSQLIQAVGFKLFYEWQGQGQEVLWQKFQEDTSLKIIHLKRKNHLRTLVSLRIAQQNKKWSKGLLEATESADSKAVSLSMAECQRHFITMQQEEHAFQDQFRHHPLLEVFYENLVQNPKDELRRVQIFLGVPPRHLETLLERQNPEPLPQLLQNFTELEMAFRDSPWHSFFTDEAIS